jgi:hypothetical protein
MTKKTFAVMIVPSIAPSSTYAARGASRCEAPQAERATKPSTAERAAERIVHDPRDRQPGDGDRDRLEGGEVGYRPVDEERRGVREVDGDEEREAGEPRRVGLPLEPVERLRQRLRGDPELLDPVEAAAVDLPDLAADAPAGVPFVGRRDEVVVERDEVERGADPGDPRDHVQPAEDQIAPAPPVVGRR